MAGLWNTFLESWRLANYTSEKVILCFFGFVFVVIVVGILTFLVSLGLGCLNLFQIYMREKKHANYFETKLSYYEKGKFSILISETKFFEKAKKAELNGKDFEFYTAWQTKWSHIDTIAYVAFPEFKSRYEKDKDSFCLYELCFCCSDVPNTLYAFAPEADAAKYQTYLHSILAQEKVEKEQKQELERKERREYAIAAFRQKPKNNSGAKS